MKFYKYKGVDKYGYNCSGSIRAESESDARRHLEDQSKKIEWIEEDYDANARMRPQTIANLSSGAASKSPWNTILSYLMPAGAALIAVGGILFVNHYVKPPTPALTATQVIEKFADLDRKGDFKTQYGLLSRQRQIFFKSAEKYEHQKKRWRRSEENGVIPFGKITGIEEKKTGLRTAECIASTFRPSGLAHIEFSMVLEGDQWRIDHFRDPVVTDLYVESIKNLPEEDLKAKFISDFKGITGYSDLQIEAFLKGRRP